MNNTKLPFSQKWFYRIGLFQEVSSLFQKAFNMPDAKNHSRVTNTEEFTVTIPTHIVDLFAQFNVKLGYMLCKIKLANQLEDRVELTRLSQLNNQAFSWFEHIKDISDEEAECNFQMAIGLIDREIKEDESKITSQFDGVCSQCLFASLEKDEQCTNCKHVFNQP